MAERISKAPRLTRGALAKEAERLREALGQIEIYALRAKVGSADDNESPWHALGAVKAVVSVALRGHPNGPDPTPVPREGDIVEIGGTALREYREKRGVVLDVMDGEARVAIAMSADEERSLWFRLPDVRIVAARPA